MACLLHMLNDACSYGTIRVLNTEMKKIVENLQSVKRNLPVTCTFSNLRKLQSGFFDYQHIITSLPDSYGQLKKQYESNCSLLKLKIDAIEDNSNSQKAARYYFKEALYHIHIEIDNIILSISSGKDNSIKEI